MNKFTVFKILPSNVVSKTFPEYIKNSFFNADWESFNKSFKQKLKDFVFSYSLLNGLEKLVENKKYFLGINLCKEQENPHPIYRGKTSISVAKCSIFLLKKDGELLIMADDGFHGLYGDVILGKIEFK